MRQAFAGMLWSKQLFYYDVKRWLDGDPSDRRPGGAPERRNAKWRNFNAFDIMSMPDKWESDRRLTLDKVAADLSDRLISICLHGRP